MKQSNKSIKLIRRKPLVKNLLLIEGISRAGKLLLANILHGFQGIEPTQCCWLLDDIPFLEKFGLMEKGVAQEMLQCEIDSRCYEMLIGRNLNHRRSDKSSIFNIPSFDNYLRRCEESDGDWAIKRFYRKNLYSMFVLHEIMSIIGIYFDTFPALKVISVQRSPIDLVSAWCQRGIGRRIGQQDPKLFMILFGDKSGPTPWYAIGWKENYRSLSEVDRTILFIERLFKTSLVAYRKLSPKNRKKILTVLYEDILGDTHGVIKKIGKFLNKKSLPEMKLILKKEHLPNKDRLSLRERRLADIKALASKPYFNRLLRLEKEYSSGSYKTI